MAAVVTRQRKMGGGPGGGWVGRRGGEFVSAEGAHTPAGRRKLQTAQVLSLAGMRISLAGVSGAAQALAAPTLPRYLVEW